MRLVNYKDSKGRWYKTQIPDGAPDSHARFGIVIGPPNLDSLELPPKIHTRLHNELFHRGLITRVDVMRRRIDIIGALQAALSVDSGIIVDLYSKES